VEAIASPANEVARVVVASSFTAEPLADLLSFLLKEVGLDLEVALAPYGQIFQELLAPGSLFRRNTGGPNVVLLRFEDWWRDAAGPSTGIAAVAERNCDDLLAALRAFAAASSAPIVFAVCPPSPSALERPESAALIPSLAERLRAGVAELPNVTLLEDGVRTPAEAAASHDASGDRLGHLPYTPVFFADLAGRLSRAVHRLKSPPCKVIVLDCDNTLWKGVVGEDGVDGIEITEAHLWLQRFVLAKKDAGMLLCLASKNVESDVLEVFRRRSEMALKLHDIIAMRVNWLPKSENLQALARELNLGLDSFVFIDDSALECAEVGASCPDVLTLRLPVDGDVARFLSNVWPLDQGPATDADRKRTQMYRESLDRDRHRRSASNLTDFLAGLELQVDIAEPAADQWPRIAQLTQRTNQFNFTTRRRSESEVLRLATEGRTCLAVHVRDRFGDYGLVGAAIFLVEDDALVLDTFLLSCRVLGRGVEHAMFRHLSGTAGQMGLTRIVAPFAPTAKNVPARQFLESLAAERLSLNGAERFSMTTARAAQLFPAAESAFGEPDEAPARAAVPTVAARDPHRSARWNRLAHELGEPTRILAASTQRRLRQRPLGLELVSPRNPTERRLLEIWKSALDLLDLGVRDPYFDVGGTSLAAVMICAEIERGFGKRLPLTALVEFPTVEALAQRIDRVEDTRSIVPLQSEGSGLPLFLIHDADGETLLYRNLARRFAGRRPVFAIQPQGREDAPIVHTRIEEMAAHYVREIQSIRPHGPYLLGGLCAAGVLSLEMALQLERAGEEAHLVAVFDAADVEAQPIRNVQNQRRLSRVREAIQGKKVTELARVLGQKGKNLVVYEARRRLQRATDRLAVGTLRLCMRNGLPLPPWARGLGVRKVYLAAESRYRPNAEIRHQIVLFRATSGEGSDEPYVQLYQDSMLGWQRRSADGVVAIDVPGGHSSMLQEPNVAQLAQVLAKRLDELDPPPTARIELMTART